MQLLSSAFTELFCTKKNIRGDTPGWWKVLLLGTHSRIKHKGLFFCCLCVCVDVLCTAEWPTLKLKTV